MAKNLHQPSWESKLLPNSREYLRKHNAEFDVFVKEIRKTESPQFLKSLKSEQLNWIDLYQTYYRADQHEFFEKFVTRVAEAGTGGRPLNLKGMRLYIGYVWTMRYTHLFILNLLPHPVELLERIKAGDEQAFMDFAKVDKSILATDMGREFISRAQLSGDGDFFTRLAKSVVFEPRALSSRTVKLYSMMLMIEGLAVKKLTIPEVCDILEDVCGTTIDDPETIRKFWNRRGLHRYTRPK